MERIFAAIHENEQKDSKSTGQKAKTFCPVLFVVPLLSGASFTCGPQRIDTAMKPAAGKCFRQSSRDRGPVYGQERHVRPLG